MKRFIILNTILLSFIITKAQSVSEVGKITIAVIMPSNVNGLDISQLSKMETKITQIVSNTGLTASGYNNNFVIYPKFSVYETNVVEGGMQNITVVTCELSLFIKQVDNNLVFSTISKKIRGSGIGKTSAITNAISLIPTNDEQLKIFIATGKEKIVSYYESKCGDIISKSESLLKMQDYEQALGLLMTVPEEVSCYNRIQEKTIETYKVYQNHKCSKQLQDAKLKLATNNYVEAINILSQIDPSTSCFKESQSLVNNVAAKVDAAEKKEWDLKLKLYNDDVALEKLRINAAKEIASSYYKGKPKTVSYTYLIR